MGVLFQSVRVPDGRSKSRQWEARAQLRALGSTVNRRQRESSLQTQSFWNLSKPIPSHTSPNRSTNWEQVYKNPKRMRDFTFEPTHRESWLEDVTPLLEKELLRETISSHPLQRDNNLMHPEDLLGKFPSLMYVSSRRPRVPTRRLDGFCGLIKWLLLTPEVNQQGAKLIWLLRVYSTQGADCRTGRIFTPPQTRPQHSEGLMLFLALFKDSAVVYQLGEQQPKLTELLRDLTEYSKKVRC